MTSLGHPGCRRALTRTRENLTGGRAGGRAWCVATATERPNTVLLCGEKGKRVGNGERSEGVPCLPSHGSMTLLFRPSLAPQSSPFLAGLLVLLLLLIVSDVYCASGLFSFSCFSFLVFRFSFLSPILFYGEGTWEERGRGGRSEDFLADFLTFASLNFRWGEGGGS